MCFLTVLPVAVLASMCPLTLDAEQSSLSGVSPPSCCASRRWSRATRGSPTSIRLWSEPGSTSSGCRATRTRSFLGSQRKLNQNLNLNLTTVGVVFCPVVDPLGSHQSFSVELVLILVQLSGELY